MRITILSIFLLMILVSICCGWITYKQRQKKRLQWLTDELAYLEDERWAKRTQGVPIDPEVLAKMRKERDDYLWGLRKERFAIRQYWGWDQPMPTRWQRPNLLKELRSKK